ncbi:MAG: HAMP domain-containing histidine kinase [Actinomycetota bacterium]|nr:HAMP domain-containing histidine kinase [Actinomycetota bacterium]
MTGHARWLWLAYIAGGLVVTAFYLAEPKGPIFNLIGLSGVGAILIGVRLNHPPSRAPWYLFALGQLLFLFGDIVAYNHRRLFGTDLPFPAISDLFYLAVYPCLIAGVVLLARHRNVERAETGFADAFIVAIGAGVLSWIYLISPYTHSTDLTALQKIVSIAYPLMDLLLLMALVRLAVGPGHRGGAFYLLVSGVGCLLVTDAIYGWMVANLPGGYTNGGLLDGGWAAFYILWAAAALHPSMREVADRGAEESHRRSLRLRLTLLAAASIATPAVQVVESLRGRPVDSPIAGICSATLFILVFVRVNGLMVDVNELKRTQGKLRHSQEELEAALQRERQASTRLRQLDEVKNTFLSAVSHELRSPLTFILGTSGLLEKHIDSLPPEEVREMVGHTRRSAKKLQSLLDDLLDVERLRQGRITLEREPVDIAELAERVVEDLGTQDEHPVIVDVPHMEILVDASKIERVLSNLISNAFKYCPPESRIWVREEHSSDGIILIVEDEGDGIAESDREVIFDAFERVDAQGSSGTGIGLSLVSKFADMHGGRAWVEERRGGGASFHVLLPRWEASSAREEKGPTSAGSIEAGSVAAKPSA